MTYLARLEFALAVTTAVFVLLLLSPHAAFAQTSSSADLRSTIRAELLSDPRTSALSQTQLDAMVDLLTKEAVKKGITAQDIIWRPQTFSNNTAAGASTPAQDQCGGSFTCIIDEAFGFVGPDTTIPFALGAASMGLVWILAEMIHRRKYPIV